MSKKKLGRGLGSLLESALDENGKVIDLDLSKIHPNPFQPRRSFDEESLQHLADSIKSNGVIQPVTVRYKDEDGNFEYELVTGERRYRAAQLAGLSTIPAILTSYDNKAMAEVALIENLQREDLNPIEECEAYTYLMDTYHLKQDELAKTVGKSRSYVANMLRLATLPEEVKEMVQHREITMGQIRPVLALNSEAEQLQMARQIVKEKMSARQSEKVAQAKKEKKKHKSKEDQQIVDYLKSIEEKLGMSVGSRVQIKLGRGKKAHQGTISISFKNEEEFQRITEFLNQTNQ